MAVRSGITVSFTALPFHYRGFRTAAMESALRKHTREFCEDVIEKMKRPPDGYPDISYQGSEYVRTQKLKGAYRPVATSRGGSISYEIQNMVKDPRGRYYARLVVGGSTGAGQYWLHAENGWRRIDEVMLDMGGRLGFREEAQNIIEDFAGVA